MKYTLTRFLLCFFAAIALAYAATDKLPAARAQAEESGGFTIVTHVGNNAQNESAAETDESDSTDSENAYITFSSHVVDAEPAPTVAPPEVAPMPLLVNGTHLVAENYKPDDLVLMRDYCDADVVTIKGSEIEGQREAVDALMEMLRAAISEGITKWQISSGYRSVAYQQKMWDEKVYAYRKEDGMSGSQARSAAGRYMARPGASEHHTGLAFDVTVPGEVSFADTKQSKWLAENCWDYGFIIRYTAEKQPITGINAEPWHVRYVGQPHAKIMQETGQCLEEYLGEVD